MPPTAVILGRPNVGKSTLFNRLTARRTALVDAKPGLTRDRRSGEVRLGTVVFDVVDTAGLEEAGVESLAARMRDQTQAALAEADVALLLIDARAGITPLDRDIADWLRKAAKPMVVLANKCERGGGQAGYLDAFSLGLGEPVAISAEHGDGIGELADAIVAALPEALSLDDDERALEEGPLRLAIVGRPNVGKSTLANRLLGEERLLTGPESGITRDAVAIDFSVAGRAVRLVDTAGLRRKARIAERMDKLASADALRAIRLAHAAVVVLDAAAPADRQDYAIARFAVEEGRAIVIALNKWDLVADRAAAMKALQARFSRSLPQAKGGRAGAALGAHRRGRRRANAGGLRGGGALGPAYRHRPPKPLAERDRCRQASAGRAGPPQPSAIHHPAARAAADVRGICEPPWRCAGVLRPFPDQRAARALRASGRADSHVAAQGPQSLRRT